MSRYAWLLLLVLVVACGRSSEPTPAADLSKDVATVTTLAEINLRAGPGFEYEQVAQVSKGAAVTVLGTARGSDCNYWVLLRTGKGQVGWSPPVLVNVDVAESDLPIAPTPAPDVLPTPMPAACASGMALLRVDNRFSTSLEVFMSGPEPALLFSLDGGAIKDLCVAPGEYCYDLTDGTEHETGSLFLPEGRCTCWHWGGGPPQPGDCRCSEDPNQYKRP